MAAYIIASYDVVDQESYQSYVQQTVPLVFKHKGEVVVATHETKSLEGSYPASNVILKFPDEEHALAWYNDPDYQAIIHLRVNNIENGSMFVAEEFVMPEG